ncbi:MAG TPA: hypothetical protein VK927_02135 [Adhaeribacter sp.]|nr:hypothetical protein [Adhaeribacter sp.]
MLLSSPSDRKTIRNASILQEKTGNLQPEVLDIIYREKLFKLFVPEEMGGLNVPLPEAIKLFEEAAFLDGSFGWAVTIGSGGGFFSAYFQPEVSGNLFGPEKAVVAGSGHPSGTALKVDGGYQVSGQWKYCSGANYATIFTATAFIPQPNGEPEMRAFAFDREQVQIIPDWNTFGLKATGSHSIKIENAFVPEEKTFDLSNPNAAFSQPVFQYPFLQFAEASFAAVNAGICRHFMEETKNLLKRNQTAWQKSNPKRYPFLAKKHEAAQTNFRQALTAFHETVTKSWQKLLTGESFTETELQEISQTCKHLVKTSVSTAQELYPYLGLSAASETSVLNQTYRDLHTACQHTLLLDFEG